MGWWVHQECHGVRSVWAAVVEGVAGGRSVTGVGGERPASVPWTREACSGQARALAPPSPGACSSPCALSPPAPSPPPARSPPRTPPLFRHTCSAPFGSDTSSSTLSLPCTLRNAAFTLTSTLYA